MASLSFSTIGFNNNALSAKGRERMSIGFKHINILGDRVRLRPMSATDTQVAYHLLTDDAILSQLEWDGPANEGEIFDTYSQWEAELKNGQSYHLAIERLDHPGLIGCIGVRFPRHHRQADIGYWLGVSFWDKGYMTDAIRLVCHFCFKYLDAVRVYATIFVGNVRSRRALEKNGFSLDGTIRCHLFKRGRWCDVWFFTLLRTEWEEKCEWFSPRNEEIVLAGSTNE